MHVWQPRLWPKISTFLWLLSKRRILTWDNLQRRGFIGPSRCPNCNAQEETIGRRERQGDITSILRSFPKQPYQSPILNSLWNLIPGFLYWALWKERNNRVFNNKRKPAEILWLILKYNLQETLALRAWIEND